MTRLVPFQRVDSTGGCPRALRERWRRTSLAAGWPFPSDWGLPAVDAVCEATVEGRDTSAALTSLGRARAEAGAGLAETLHDVAALHRAVGGSLAVPDDLLLDLLPTREVRAIAIGWADLTHAELATSRVVDGLTGLATTGYLRTRLAELYRSAQASGLRAADRHVLVLLALDLRQLRGWSRVVPMLLAAEAMRAVFDGGESLAATGPSVAVVLCRRDARLPERTARLRALAGELLAADPDASAAGPPRVWLERLPPDYAAACDLITHLGR